jgi:hypothetical protein
MSVRQLSLSWIIAVMTRDARWVSCSAAEGWYDLNFWGSGSKNLEVLCRFLYLLRVG